MVKFEVGDIVEVGVIRTKGVVTETSMHRVKVRFESMSSESNESSWWYDKNWVRKVEKQDEHR